MDIWRQYAGHLQPIYILRVIYNLYTNHTASIVPNFLVQVSDWFTGRRSQLGGGKTSFASFQTVEGSNSKSKLKCFKDDIVPGEKLPFPIGLTKLNLMGSKFHDEYMNNATYGKIQKVLPELESFGPCKVP